MSSAPVKSAREISKVNWRMPVANAESSWPAGGIEVVNMGSQLRIADALERIATRLEADATQQRADIRNARITNRRLRTQIRNLQAKLSAP